MMQHPAIRIAMGIRAEIRNRIVWHTTENNKTCTHKQVHLYNKAVIMAQASNRLINETSPYLLQHAHNPVDWRPWGEEAFAKAKAEDKPVFLSIGYSTCHWCHVMAHESFEDTDVAQCLNRSFISIKVDREERPDIDGVYMRACQTMTGSGGWPTSIFMSADGKPFFAGTYFPKEAFLSLLDAIARAWQGDRGSLLESGERLAGILAQNARNEAARDDAPIARTVETFRRTFDLEYGGFGGAPKFPSPHNLMFLLNTAPELAEKTLLQMFRGGIFDHIGGGFSRYSTDRYWLVPHFEKMLYDNALLAMAYLMAYETTGKALYRSVAERVFGYLEREMRAPDGGLFSAQDADSEGTEGKYYVFTPQELEELLGEADGKRFCLRYGITPVGNFEGKSIPNLLRAPEQDDAVDAFLPKVYEYRRRRIAPHTDKKELTAWNALAAAAYAMAARILKHEAYLNRAREIVDWIERELTEGNTVFAGVTDGKRSGPGFLDDYAFSVFALIQMHQATLEDRYLSRAAELTERAGELFWDEKDGGFFFSGVENETLIARPKESWDSAMPSGNSVMAYNLSRLALLTEEERFTERAQQQRRYMNGEASDYPVGYSFFLYAALPVKKVVCVPQNTQDLRALHIRSNWALRVTEDPAYPIVSGKTTYYICENGTCLPPVNKI